MNMKNICIILVNPDESRNIGSACRAMANMGINDLRIIGEKESFNDTQVRTLAVHATALWDNAKFFETLTEATKDCVIVAGTTRRRGKKRKEWLVTPEEFCSKVEFLDNANIAVVFGNERTGLEDEELEVCTIGVSIPSSDQFPSLNLSHAVQIMCYKLFRTIETPTKTGYTPITLDRLDNTVSKISESLETIGFFSLAGKRDMEFFWRNILSRAVLSESEAQYIEKTFQKAAGLSKK